MLIKILLVAVMLFLLRSHLGVLKPFWPVLVGFLVGAFIGWQIVKVLIALKVNLDFLEMYGYPRHTVKPLFVLICAFVSAGPISAAITVLLAPFITGKDNVRRL